MFCVFYEYRSFSEAFLQRDAILLSFSICNVSSSLIFYFYLDTVYYRDCLYYFLFVSLFHSHIFSFFFIIYNIFSLYIYNIFSLYIYPSFFPFPSETLVTRYFYLRLINVRLSFSILFVRQFPLSFLELVLPLRGGYPLALSFYPFSSRHISPQTSILLSFEYSNSSQFPLFIVCISRCLFYLIGLSRRVIRNNFMHQFRFSILVYFFTNFYGLISVKITDY